MKILAVMFLAMLVWGCISSEQLKQELAEEVRAACESSGFKIDMPGFQSRGAQYCVLRTLYLRKVALGGVSSAGVSAFVTIDNNRLDLIARVNASDFLLNAPNKA